MTFGTKRAALLEQSLQGHESLDQEIQDLVATADRICVLGSLATPPSDEFVSALGVRLRAEALTLPARELRRVPPATVGRGLAAGPIVFVIGRRLPRILAGATASVLLIGAIVGGTSRSALPGGVLYPMKQLLNSAAVQLAGSDYDRGMTLLAQAQEHIDEAAALVNRDGTDADSASVDQTLLSAYDAISGGQRALLGDYDRTGDAQALMAIRDFTVVALPALNALRPLVPAASVPDVDAIIALLHSSDASLVRKIAACGQPCVSLGGTTLGIAPLAGVVKSMPTATGPGAANPGSVLVPGELPVDGSVPTGSSPVVTGPNGAAVAPSVPPLLTTTSGTLAVSAPALTLGPLVISPSAIVIPPVLDPVLDPVLSSPLLSPLLSPTLPLTLPTGLLGLG